jgi:hypothetical protein
MLDTINRESIDQPKQAGLKFPEIPAFAARAQAHRQRQERPAVMNPGPAAPKRARTAARSTRVFP